MALSQGAYPEAHLPLWSANCPSRSPLTLPTAPDWGLALGISTSDFAARAFTRDPSSLKSVRCFVRDTAAAWGIGAVADDLTLVVNELTTNAVRHALRLNSQEEAKAWLGIARTGGAVLCAVSDPSPAPPLPHRPQGMAVAGRGLLVVDALTNQWGYASAAPGKTVWARLTAHSR
ncbi:ATP-binding protein [Streptomyces sp. CL12-4]|uniref:ATP-binding protein n=1 Tax=Streptomyces sp. CL12-4 TaxID=2810306 RepID=UPI001EFB99C3|nr:ATP-binding protein [Streptomyces sp. CL12-4]